MIKDLLLRNPEIGRLPLARVLQQNQERYFAQHLSRKSTYCHPVCAFLFLREKSTPIMTAKHRDGIPGSHPPTNTPTPWPKSAFPQRIPLIPQSKPKRWL